MRVRHGIATAAAPPRDDPRVALRTSAGTKHPTGILTLEGRGFGGLYPHRVEPLPPDLELPALELGVPGLLLVVGGAGGAVVVLSRPLPRPRGGPSWMTQFAFRSEQLFGMLVRSVLSAAKTLALTSVAAAAANSVASIFMARLLFESVEHLTCPSRMPPATGRRSPEGSGPAAPRTEGNLPTVNRRGGRFTFQR